MLRKVHESHLGMDKCKATARSVMYWPNLSSDIENMVTKPSICARGNQLYHIQCQIDHGPSLVPISLTLMERTILYLWTISQNGQKLASSHAKQPAQWYHIWKPTPPDMVYPMNWLPIICLWVWWNEEVRRTMGFQDYNIQPPVSTVQWAKCENCWHSQAVDEESLRKWSAPPPPLSSARA